MNNIYEIDNFSFGYYSQKKSVEIKGKLTIKKNDIVLLSGNSGSGKTTLLYALKGLIPDTIFGKMSGTILFNGVEIQKIDTAQKLKIGLLFQNPNAQMINKKVINELAFGLENLKLPSKEIKKKIFEIAEKFEVTHLLNRDTIGLSGGEKQKIALLSILLTNPDVLLFDEPTAFLDPESAKLFVETFKKIIKNKTVIIVEHNLHYLKEYVNKIIKIENRIAHSIEPNNFQWDFDLPKINNDFISDKTILEIKNLSFNYKKQANLLKNINLIVRKGEIISIIGKNGAGKSTLLKLMAKILKPVSGEIILEDKINYSLKEYYKKLSLLWQNPENHFLFDKVKKEADINKLELFGLEELADNNPFTLSEGEKRRLSLAIIFNNEPELLLMDEPTFGQDPQNKIALIKMLELLIKKQKSIVIVSHDLKFVYAVSDKIYKLEDGSLYEIK